MNNIFKNISYIALLAMVSAGYVNAATALEHTTAAASAHSTFAEVEALYRTHAPDELGHVQRLNTGLQDIIAQAPTTPPPSGSTPLIELAKGPLSSAELTLFTNINTCRVAMSSALESLRLSPSLIPLPLMVGSGADKAMVWIPSSTQYVAARESVLKSLYDRLLPILASAGAAGTTVSASTPAAGAAGAGGM